MRLMADTVTWSARSETPGPQPMQAPPMSKQSDKARADVKKDTAAANKAGTIEKGAAVPKATKPMSDHTRAETKAEAAREPRPRR